MLDLTIEQKDNYLYVNLIGDFEIEKAIILTTQIYEAAAEKKYTKILIDGSNILTPLTFSDRLTYIKFLAEENLNYCLQRNTKVKIAYLLSPQSIDPRKFGETFASNRSVNIKVDTNKNSCLNWLLES